MPTVDDGLGLSPSSFSDLDASGCASDGASYLNRVAGLMAEYRPGWFDHLNLRPGATVLDAGCGLGEVAAALAAAVTPAGRAIGVDQSAELIERARHRFGTTVDFRVGDVAALRFDDATFDAAYSERVFQHLHDPARAMSELFRVLHPGGRLTVVDIDHTRTAIDADDADLADLMSDLATLGVANARAGRHLRAQAVTAGFVDVSVAVTVLVLADSEQFQAMSPRSLAAQLGRLVETGTISQERADAYAADQAARQADGRFLAAATLYCVEGTRP